MMFGNDRAREARKLLHQGQTIEQVVAHFGGRFPADQIMAGIEHVRAINRNYNRRYFPSYRGGLSQLHIGMRREQLEVPPELYAERERRAAAPLRDLTAFYTGDPPVGYSALDRPRIESPSIISDPLDGLVFRVPA